MRNKFLRSVGLLVLWFIVYGFLPAFSKFITYDILRLSAGSRLASAVEFFMYDAPKVLMLLALVVFGVGIIRTFFTPQRTRQMLVGKKEFVGKKARTSYTITPLGLSRLSAHLDTMTAIKKRLNQEPTP